MNDDGDSQSTEPPSPTGTRGAEHELSGDEQLRAGELAADLHATLVAAELRARRRIVLLAEALELAEAEHRQVRELLALAIEIHAVPLCSVPKPGPDRQQTEVGSSWDDQDKVTGYGCERPNRIEAGDAGRSSPSSMARRLAKRLIHKRKRGEP